MSRMLIVLGLLILLYWVLSAQLKAVDYVAPPPDLYARGPTLTGSTVERQFDNVDALRKFCNEQLGAPPVGYYLACYVPKLDVVALPSRFAEPSKAQRLALREHEWAHARGWRHQLRLRRINPEGGPPIYALGP